MPFDSFNLSSFKLILAFLICFVVDATAPTSDLFLLTPRFGSAVLDLEVARVNCRVFQFDDKFVRSITSPSPSRKKTILGDSKGDLGKGLTQTPTLEFRTINLGKARCNYLPRVNRPSEMSK